MGTELQIDQEFKSLIPPLASDEYQQLEENILKDGCRDAILTWNGIVIDGHNRYEICQKHNRFFVSKEVGNQYSLLTRADVREWIIRNQFGRRNLTAYDRSKLALQLEELIQAKAKVNMSLGGGDQKSGTQKSAEPIRPVETRKEIAKIAGVSHDTIAKVKEIEKEATSEQKAKLSAGETKINTIFNEIQQEKAVIKYPDLKGVPKSEIVQTAKKLDSLPQEDRPKVVQLIRESQDNLKNEGTEDRELLKKAQKFKEGVDRIISNLHLMTGQPIENYFMGIDEVEAAFNQVSVFADNQLIMIDKAISWLTDFRKEYQKRLQGNKKLERVK